MAANCINLLSGRAIITATDRIFCIGTPMCGTFAITCFACCCILSGAIKAYIAKPFNAAIIAHDGIVHIKPLGMKEETPQPMHPQTAKASKAQTNIGR